MGIDPVELRRRNHVRREEMPYQVASGLTYDSGDFRRAARQGGRAVRSRRLRGAQGRKQRPRQAAGTRRRPVPRGDRHPHQRDGRHPLRGGRFGHHRHRDDGQRPGPPLRLRPDHRVDARHSVRQDPPRPGRQRRTGRRRRHRRVAIAHGERRRLRRGKRQGDCERPSGGIPLSRGGGSATSVSRRALSHRRHRPQDRHPGARRSAEDAETTDPPTCRIASTRK